MRFYNNFYHITLSLYRCNLKAAHHRCFLDLSSVIWSLLVIWDYLDVSFSASLGSSRKNQVVCPRRRAPVDRQRRKRPSSFASLKHSGDHFRRFPEDAFDERKSGKMKKARSGIDWRHSTRYWSISCATPRINANPLFTLTYTRSRSTSESISSGSAYIASSRGANGRQS